MHAVIDAFTTVCPDPFNPDQAVRFGTSGHRGRADEGSFNHEHILAITQAVVAYRRQQGINGPLFLGRDSHALSLPAWITALTVLVANGVEVRIERHSPLTATPLISHAILRHNRRHHAALADGLIITPSHNPPEDGGIKYNPPHGGPAGSEATAWIEAEANRLLAANLVGVVQVNLMKALNRAVLHDMLGEYVEALGEVIDMQAIAASGLRLAADPMGGTALPVWQAIVERYGLNLKVLNTTLDSSFAFMPPDHDGKIRMDCFPTGDLSVTHASLDDSLRASWLGASRSAHPLPGWLL